MSFMAQVRRGMNGEVLDCGTDLNMENGMAEWVCVSLKGKLNTVVIQISWNRWVHKAITVQASDFTLP